MTQDQQLQPLKNGLQISTKQRELMLSAVAGKKVLSSLQGHQLKTEIILADNSLLPVSALRRESEKEVIMFVSAVIKEMCSFVKNSFTDDTIVDTAIMLVNEFNHWKVEEFAILCKEIISGKYGRDRSNPSGKIFGMLDAKTIFEAANEREESRSEEWSKVFHNKNQAVIEKAKITEEEDARIKEIITEVKNKLSVNNSKPLTFQNKEKNDICQNILREFDKEYRDQKNPSSKDEGQRFIVYKKKHVSESEYLEIRFKEIHTKS